MSRKKIYPSLPRDNKDKLKMGSSSGNNQFYPTSGNRNGTAPHRYVGRCVSHWPQVLSFTSTTNEGHLAHPSSTPSLLHTYKLVREDREKSVVTSHPPLSTITTTTPTKTKQNKQKKPLHESP